MCDWALQKSGFLSCGSQNFLSEKKREESILRGDGQLLHRFINSTKGWPILPNLVFVGSIYYKVAVTWCGVQTREGTGRKRLV